MSTISFGSQDPRFQQTSKVEVSRGNENFLANGLRNFFSIPQKIIYWNSNMNSGNISDKTIQRVTTFLEENRLSDVGVNVNEYDPIKHIGRVFSNPHTSGLSKYTFGLFSSVSYIFEFNKYLGGRSDYYDYTSNDIHLYSEDPDIALLMGAQALAFNEDDAPSVYSIKQSLPLVGPFIYASQNEDQLEIAASYVDKNDTERVYKRAWSVMAPLSRIPAAFAVLSSVMCRTIVINPLADIAVETGSGVLAGALVMLPILTIFACHGTKRARSPI